MKSKSLKKPLSFEEFDATLSRAKYYKIVSTIFYSAAVFSALWFALVWDQNFFSAFGGHDLFGLKFLANQNLSFAPFVALSTFFPLGFFVQMRTPRIATKEDIAMYVQVLLSEKNVCKYLEEVGAMHRPLLSTELSDLLEYVVDNKELKKARELAEINEKISAFEMEFAGIIVSD